MTRTNPAPAPGEQWQKRLREAAFLLLLPIAVYLMACFLSYSPSDPGWSHLGTSDRIANFGGAFGAWMSDLTLYLIGVSAYALPLLLLALGAAILRGGERIEHSALEPTLRLVGFVTFFIAASGLAALRLGHSPSFPAGQGGVLGALVGGSLTRGFGGLGASLFLLALLLAAVTLATGLSWFRVMDAIGAAVVSVFTWATERWQRTDDWSAAQSARARREASRKADVVRKAAREPIRIEPTVPAIEKSERAQRETQIPLFTGASEPGELPPLALLDEPAQRVKGYSDETLEALSRQVELKLKDFRIDAQVVGVYPGPVITRFELQPAPGIKGSQISALDKDIARGLSVPSVRVVDVIPGKSVIGLEIPNTNRETVYLSEILRSKEFDGTKSPVALALGKDIGGRPVVVDLARMPHLLVAGTTGSGKSVALNAMVLSLLYKASAADVRLIMIDPKMLELSAYEGIPHLLSPVVTDMKEAANALRWCVAEMERRYKLMAAVGVRNLAGLNKKVRDATESGQPLLDPLFIADPAQPERTAEPLRPLPFVVVVIDEFADMMMIVGKKVEELIARLAQKARAAGVHLIVATQRPSVDVITGLIKANIPTRIAFQVSSKVDSRTILDQSGAETLLGQGDMLYLPAGTATPERVHGAFVDDHEVHDVVAWLRTQGTPEFVTGVLEDVQPLGDGRVIGQSGLPEDAATDDTDQDELYDRAVAIVTESRRASISGVQRRLKIGYNRAARLIERMEAEGVVSPPETNGNREVLAPPPPEH